MRRFFIPTDQLAANGLTIGGPEARHLQRVLRLGVGDEIELFDGRGLVARAVIRAQNRDQVETRIIDRRRVALPTPRLHLALGLLKGGKMELVVQKATELGVHALWPLRTDRAVRKTTSRSQQRRLRKIIIEACKQCGRPYLLDARPEEDLPAFLEHAGELGQGLIFYEGERETDLTNLDLDYRQDIVALVGPEGGFSPGEVELARQSGFIAVGLGPSVLRAETAAIATTAILMFLAGRLAL